MQHPARQFLCLVLCHTLLHLLSMQLLAVPVFAQQAHDTLLFDVGIDMGETDGGQAVQQALIRVAALLQRPPADTADKGNAVKFYKVGICLP